MKKIFIRAAMIFVSLLAVTAIVLLESRVTGFKASRGILNLIEWDFEKQGLVNLNGEWEIYENKLLEPPDLKGEKPSGYFNIPGTLKANIKNSKYMTLRLKINAKDETVYGLRINGLLSASKIWVNGILHAEVGKVGTSFQDEHAIYLPAYAYFSAESGVIDIVIQTSGYREVFPVIKVMEFGTKSQVMNKYLLAVTIDLIIIGGLLVIQLLFLALYRRHQENKSLVYFAVLCLFIQLRCLFLNERVIVQFFPDMHYEVLSKIAALTYYLYIPVYVLFLKEQFIGLPKKLIYVSSIFGLGFGSICLVTQNIFYDRLSFFGEGMLLAIAWMVLRFLIDRVRHKEKNALISLTAYIILIVTAFNDVLVNNGMNYGKYLAQIGTFVFAILETYILAINYSDEIKKTQKLEAANKMIYESSIRDSLTGLYNRSYIEKMLDDMLESYLNKGSHFSIIMFDIDYFKSINDTYGHLVGDEVLVKVAEIIKENLRYMDYAGRYGGEEFIVLLHNTNIQKAVELAEKIRRSIEHFAWGDKLKITISGGVYENNSDQKNEAIENADKLLYQAKEKGRNRICASFAATRSIDQ